MKTCPMCGETKTVESFSNCSKRKDGKQYYCKNCSHNNNIRWQREHPDRHRARYHAWQRANPEMCRIAVHKRRAILAGSTVSIITPHDWNRLVRRFNGRCAYCGINEKMTQDHVIPISRGGAHTIGNLLPACSLCNSRKGRRLLVELGWRVQIPVSG